MRKRLGDIRFQVGDVLLLQGSDANLEEHASALQLLPLAEREVRVGIFSKVGLAVAIFAAAITVSMLGIMPTTLSFLCAIIVYVFLDILPARDIYREVDWAVIVLLGAMIPVSGALVDTGLTAKIAGAVVSHSHRDDRHYVPLRHHQQRRDRAHHGSNQHRNRQDDGRQRGSFSHGGRRRRLVRVSHAHWSSMQRPCPWPRRLPLWRLLAHGAAAGGDHRGGGGTADPNLLPAFPRSRLNETCEHATVRVFYSAQP